MNIHLEKQAYTEGRVRLRIPVGNGKYINTGVAVRLKDLSKNFAHNFEDAIRGSNEGHTHLNNMIRETYYRIMDVLEELRAERVLPSGEEIVKRFYADRVIVDAPIDPTISSLLPVLYKTKEDQFKPYPAKTKYLFERAIIEFTNCFGDIRLSALNKDKWSAFSRYLASDEVTKHMTWKAPSGKVHTPQDPSKKEPLGVTAIIIRLKNLRKFFRVLKDEGYQFPLDTNKLPIPSEIKKKVHMTLIDMAKVEAWEPETEDMKLIKDLMTFQSYTALRISDLFRVKGGDITPEKDPSTGHIDYFLQIVTKKNKKLMQVPLSEAAVEVYKKYSFEDEGKIGFSLPQITEQYYNRRLKELVVAAGIDKPISWEENGKTVTSMLSVEFTNHCCSRTAIAYFGEVLRIPLEVVADIVGKKEKTISEYYRVSASKSTILDMVRNARAENAAIMSINRKVA